MFNKLKEAVTRGEPGREQEPDELFGTQKIVVRIQGGYFVATEASDPDYPGIDVEFVSDSDNGEYASRPRVLFERPVESGELRALIWNDKNSEDYTEEIIFEEQRRQNNE